MAPYSKLSKIKSRVVDRHRIDAELGPTFHFDADPDPDPATVLVNQKLFFNFFPSNAGLRCFIFLVSVMDSELKFSGGGGGGGGRV
jgi:hypothetical protein